MRRCRTRAVPITAIVALLALAGLAPGPARAQSVLYAASGNLLSQRIVDVGFSGSIAVSFQGDPITCASRGVCGYSGTVIWRPGVANPGAAIALLTFREHGRIVREAYFTTFGGLEGPSTLKAVVRRALVGSGAATCGDASAPDTQSTLRRHGAALEVRVIGAGSSVLSTRCAGPLDADIAGAVPARTVAIAALGHRGGVIDLAGTHAFAAGGFAGTVTSTLVLHLLGEQSLRQRAQRGSRERIVSLPLTIAQPAATLTAAIRGSTLPDVCAVLDACGARGALTLSLRPTVIHMTLSAAVPVRRPYADVLAALGLSRRGRPAGISAFAAASLGPAGGLSASWAAPSSCRDAAQIEPGTIDLIATAGRMVAGYAPAGPLRLRCPGPEVVSSQPGGLAGALTSVRTLARRRFTLTLRATGAISDDGYTGRITGTLPLVIRTGKVSQRIVRSVTEVVGVAAPRARAVS